MICPESFDMCFKIIAALVGLITAIVAIINFSKSISNRENDLLWRKADAANDVIHAIHENEHSAAALSMLDWFKVAIPIQGDKEPSCEVLFPDAVATLQRLITTRSMEGVGPKDYEILEAFDWFFYFIDRIEQKINQGFFNFEHVCFVFLPYYEKIFVENNGKDADVFIKFMQIRWYVLAPGFWKRFDNWKKSSDYPQLMKE